MGFYIGNVYIKNQVILAPMAGITSEAYRKIAIEYGAGLVYAEMVSDKGISFSNEKSLKMLEVSQDEHPISMQIFGSSVESIVQAAKYVNDNSNCDIIDINMGCPVNKIAKKSEAGSALLKDPQKIYEIVKEVKKVINKPLTIKIRSGWDFDSINAKEVAILAEKAGADAIAIHARTRSQMYSGSADWNIIKEVKSAVKIPVIGNGDVKSVYDAKRMLLETGCDAVMIGRASRGNPFLIRDTVKFLENNIEPIKPSYEEIKKVILEHYDYLLKLKGEHIALLEIRGQIPYYLKGLPNSSYVNGILFQKKTINEIKDLLDNYFKL